MTDLHLQHEIEQLLYREAQALDQRRFDDWLEFFTKDARYTSPIVPVQNTPAPVSVDRGFGIFNDDKDFLDKRIKRLATDYAHAETPPSRTRHLLTNVQIEEVDDAALRARVNFIVFQSRLENTEAFFVGERADRLVRYGDHWRIAERQILFDHRTLPRVLSVLF
ncbi:MAG: aromatic-ring-hydroxylating dioxygenase subunit beta [Pseudomonadota bacterium]|nr:aromatic-ring-hydroxylating dioxygenase subunit beta [Pseudomonadota bacterium]